MEPGAHLAQGIWTSIMATELTIDQQHSGCSDFPNNGILLGIVLWEWFEAEEEAKTDVVEADE